MTYRELWEYFYYLFNPFLLTLGLTMDLGTYKSLLEKQDRLKETTDNQLRSEMIRQIQIDQGLFHSIFTFKQEGGQGLITPISLVPFLSEINDSINSHIHSKLEYDLEVLVTKSRAKSVVMANVSNEVLGRIVDLIESTTYIDAYDECAKRLLKGFQDLNDPSFGFLCYRKLNSYFCKALLIKENKTAEEDILFNNLTCSLYNFLILEMASNGNLEVASQLLSEWYTTVSSETDPTKALNDILELSNDNDFQVMVNHYKEQQREQILSELTHNK